MAQQTEHKINPTDEAEDEGIQTCIHNQLTGYGHLALPLYNAKSPYISPRNALRPLSLMR